MFNVKAGITGKKEVDFGGLEDHRLVMQCVAGCWDDDHITGFGEHMAALENPADVVEMADEVWLEP